MNLLPLFRRFKKRHSALHQAFTLIIGFLSVLPASPATADILRGGGPGAANVATPGVDPVATAQAVNEGRSNASNILTRSSQAYQAALALQAQARAAALAGPNNAGINPNVPGQVLPNVPNGLGVGGLEVAPGVGTDASKWIGAELATQETVNDHTTVTVEQKMQQALLQWKTFNIGKETTLKFDQSAGGTNAGQWIAFNLINDPSGSPSQILGSIQAQGQVYVINQNGIIFGGSSQVNTHALVASSLPINGNLVQRGLLNNPDAQFLFSALAQPAGTKGPTDAFTPPALPASGRIGDVVVQAGAQITAPTTAENVGGRVVLVGPNVVNNGTISTPDGQTILAAGLQVGFVAHSSSDPSLRGLDVYVGAVIDPASLIPAYAGTATNSGVIDAPRANVTIAGKEVVQKGAINSSTSVALNGRIDLLANYDAVANSAYDPVQFPDLNPFLFQKTGHVELGANSVTQILPEWDSDEKINGTELALRSEVNIQGLTAYFGTNSSLLAPNALVDVKAGVWDYVPGAQPRSTFVYSGGQIYLDSGARINVAGSTDVEVPVTQNLITLQLRASELADSPLQRDGILRGQTITVDIRKTGTFNGRDWVGTPLADISGYVNLIQRSVGELTVAGGSVDLNAGGSVVMQNGAEVNTSAGWINYTGGTIETTKLISGGFIYDIANARPDLVYSGIYTADSTRTDLTWALSSSIDQPITPGMAYYDPGYLLGGNGGHLGIKAASMALDGSLLGLSIAGPTQRTAPPKLSDLSITFEAQELLTNVYPVYSPTPPTVTFQNGVSQPAAAAFTRNASGQPTALSATRLSDVYLSPTLLTTSGFGKITVDNAEGRIVVPEATSLTAALRGSIVLRAANLDIFGTLSAPGGAIQLTALKISPSQVAAVQRDPFPTVPNPNSPINASRGYLTLGSNARVSTAGTWTDDRIPAGTAGRLNFVKDAGSISISAYTADLRVGSVLNVNGGLFMSAQGTVSFGNAGSISIQAGQDVSLGYVLGGRLLNFGSTLLGYSGAHGGSLTVQAPLVQVGGAALHADTLLLQPEFFQTGGFTHFKVGGLGIVNGATFIPGVYIAPNTVIEPVTDSWTLVPGTELGVNVIRNPVGLRDPMKIEFSAPGINGLTGLAVRGDILMGLGSIIRTDPRATVSLVGNTVTVLGSIVAPGGTINISGGRDSFRLLFDDQTRALSTVYIGSQSLLSTAGVRVLVPDAYGRRRGEILAGGTISVSGNIAAAAGAVLDVSGTSDILDLHPVEADAGQSYYDSAGNNLPGSPYSLYTVATRVDSNGGNIVLSGGQLLASDATLRGNAGGATALGGALFVSSGRFYLPDEVQPVLDTNLNVMQSGPVIGVALPENATAIGRVVQGVGGSQLLGGGYFAANSFNQSGMDSLTLDGVVQFVGPVSLQARGYLRVADSGVLFANSQVNLNAAAVILGQAFALPVRPEDRVGQLPFTGVAPTYGTGSLNVQAGHVEVGTLNLQGIGSATLAANNGDLIGNGILAMAGNLTLRAAQVYTTTASEFTAVAYDYSNGAGSQKGSLTIERSGGLRSLPLSAGGTLSFYASTIQQNGVLRAPIGTINLGWDGTGTAPRELLTGTSLPFPVTSQLTLGANSITSVSAIDPITGQGVIIPYGVSLDGTSWIDPRGVDITAGGLHEKVINILAENLTLAAGSEVDLRGGGDLQAYRWIEGNGGTQDILNTDTSFAVIPGYTSNVAPASPFNTSTAATNLIQGAGQGYVNGSLHVGDRIFLAGTATLPAGYYTLLPARYALLPGAVLVTPKSGGVVGVNELPGNVSVTSGYTYNSLNTARTLPTLASRFEVIGSGVINARSEYQLLSANTFLKESAGRLNIAAPLLPQDSGYLLLQATQSMNLQGAVSSTALTAAGRGALIDITAPLAIAIASVTGASTPGTISLNAATLSAFGAESLLIGGKRTRTSSGTTITVQSTSIVVNNAGTMLSAEDLTLASKGNITLASGAQLASTGSLVGTAAVFSVQGNGSLLRLSQSASAQVTRSNATAGPGTGLIIGAGAQLSGVSATLDTTGTTTLDSTANLSAQAYALNSGRISLQLDQPGSLQASPGLVLTSSVLGGFSSASKLSLLSYSSIDVYGTGTVGSSTLESLTLSAGSIRGFNQAGGTARFAAKNILLNNQANVSASATAAGASGSLTFAADTVRVGSHVLTVDQFQTVNLSASQNFSGEGVGGLLVLGALNVQTPQMTGAAGANQTLAATGNLTLTSPGGTAGAAGGLGSSLTLIGANVAVNTQVILPSGSLSIRSTSGNLTIGSRLDVSGTSQSIYEVTKYTNAGDISLTSDLGSVILNAGSVVSVAAHTGGGNAGNLRVSAAYGSFNLNGSLLGGGGLNGLNGGFELDTSSLPSLAPLSTALTNAHLTQSQTIRVRSGNVAVDGIAKATTFRLSADQGTIRVTGTIDASGQTGGSIYLASRGDLVLSNGSVLTVAGQNFDSAGKGGSISLEAGTQRNGILGSGVVDIQTGSTLNLSVAAKVAGDASTWTSSAFRGQFSGTLHIRAPQTNAFTDIAVNPINGTIVDASSILVEGYRLYDLTTSGGVISSTIQADIRTNAENYLGTLASPSAHFASMTNRLLANNAGLASLFVLAPGAEVINRVGGLTLGDLSSNTTSDWNLATFRFGGKGAPGVLTLRAAGNVTFYNALSDGFTTTLGNSDPTWLWTARMTTQSTLLPVNAQTWSYRITAGADMEGSDYRSVLPLSSLASGSGSLIVGKDGDAMVSLNGDNAVTSAIIGATLSTGGRGLFQVIRTGSGNIDINAGRSIQLANQFATIYTAGTRVLDPTIVGNPALGLTFELPSLSQAGGTGALGAVQQNLPAVWSLAGGNVWLKAGENIERTGVSSSRQLPNNWLYRRGYVNSATGQFDRSGFGSSIASTAWWIDFSNFFEGIGALGGGNVTLQAGNNITNVDAVIPTNGRMAKGAPSAANLLEIGGGDLVVRAGNNIDAGVYYVERGRGVLSAGGEITTNATRSPAALSLSTGANEVLDPSTWLPTTLFVGKGGFDVSARGNVLLGPVANAFLMPQGVNNSYWNKTYFSTYAADSYVNVSSLGGSLTLRQGVTVNNTFQPLLQAWMESQMVKTATSSAYYQPWLRLVETNVAPFSTVFSLMTPTLRVTAYSGDINLQGNLTLFPAANGTLDLLTRGSINGLQATGQISPSAGSLFTAWGASRIVVSDANPGSVPGVASPFAYQNLVGTTQATTTQANFLEAIDKLFRETGGTIGSLLESRQALHTPGMLHVNDTQAVRIYAQGGDISGLELFSPKVTRLFASRDVADVALYLQNLSRQDASIVAAGRDVILYNPNTLLRVEASQTGNVVVETVNGRGNGPLAGDVQISGPGTVQILAGRNLDLGSGSNNADGTGVGLTSIGNGRNPYLSFEGANIVAGAGIGPATGLSDSQLDFATFISSFVLGPNSQRYLAYVSDDVASPMTPAQFAALPEEEQKRLALEIFYLVLRDAGRDHNDPDAEGYGSYEAGKAAIAALFPGDAWQGNITTQARDIRTKSGGSISLFAPGGMLTLATSLIGSLLSPPGIITDAGGNISIFTHGSVNLGISRIFTLKGGNEIIWSSIGDIAAGSSSKTVQAAPPTRVIIDPQSADVATDLAGLATGGGIGVLASVKGVPPGSVDLIAPLGVVDAGDAGIRATGNLNIAATQVLNAGNISVGGSSAGTPSVSVSAPNMGAVGSAANAGAAAGNVASNNQAAAQRQDAVNGSDLPSIISVEVLGYGGGDDEDEDDRRRRLQRQHQEAE